MAKVERRGDCWLWTGSLDGKGYAAFSCGSRRVRASRWAYEHWIGPIPAGHVVDHLCETPSCVNPEHLQAITNSLNTILGHIKGLEAAEREYLKRLLDDSIAAVA